MKTSITAGRRQIRTVAYSASVLMLCSVAVGAQESGTEDAHHEIEEIVVSVSPIGRTIKELAQPTSVLEGDALAVKRAASIGETLSGEVGVSSSYFGPVASRPVIRGQYGERVRVLSNSLDAMDASALSSDHAVAVEGILADRIEIVRGPATLLYGSGAAGGLVNVVDNRIMERPLDEPVSGALALGTDSATGRRSGAAKVAFGNSAVAAHFDYYRLTTENVKIPGFAESALFRALEEEEHHDEEDEHEDEHDHEHEEEAYGVVENTDSVTEGGAAAITFTGDKGFVGVSVSMRDSNYGIPGHAHAHEHEEEHEDEEHEEEHEEHAEAVRVDLEQTRVDVKGEYSLSGPFKKARFRLAKNDYTHMELEGTEIGTIFNSDGLDARVEIQHAIGDRFDGAFGLQYKSVDFEALGDEAFVPPTDTSQLSLFVFEEYALTDDWTLQGSARVERQTLKSPLAADYEDDAFGVSIGAIWSLSDALALSANLVHSERHPNATELYADGAHLAVGRIERGSVTLGNGQLDKELSTNLDLTLRGNYERFDFTFTTFINDVDDYILLTATGLEDDELPVFHYGQDDVTIVGFEAELGIELMDSEKGHLHSRFFSDYAEAEEKVSGNYLSRMPPLRFGFGLHYSRNALGAALNVVYHDDQNKSAVNELATEGYTMLNAELSYTFNEPDVFLFVRGTNLTDEDARQNSSPLKDTFPLPGRSLQLGLRYNF